jgi:3-oxoadipate enol-lactonase
VIPAHREDGAGPVVLLPASLGTTVALWEPQLPALAAEFRVVRFTFRGHGGSPDPPGPYTVEALAGDALDLLDALDVERASVCGLSLGGTVAMWLAANAPERVDRLVLACTSARFSPVEVWTDRAATVRRFGTPAVVDAALARWFADRTRATRPEVVERFREDFCRVGREGYAGCCEALAAWSFADRLGRIAAPTLVLGGAEDPVCPRRDVATLADGIPGARLQLLPEASHLANVEAPEAFTDALVAHLRGDSDGPKEVA